MPANKNALIRYKTIDNCLRNKFRRWTLQDLVEACSDALYEMEDIYSGVSVRTVQNDLYIMRSDKLGYNAPIEVYDNKYYRYSDPDFSITQMELSQNDYEILTEAVDLLRQLQDFRQFGELTEVVNTIQDKLCITRANRRPVINMDRVPDLKGLSFLTPLYDHIQHKRTLRIQYKPFSSGKHKVYELFPYVLKEFRNRWFLFGATTVKMKIFNLALDRIESIEPCDVKYREHPDFDPVHFFDDVIGVTKDLDSPADEIIFSADAYQSNYILTKPLHPSQTLIQQNPEDGRCIFRIKVVINNELFSVLMSYGPGIRVISPPRAVDHMKQQLAKAAEQYGE